MFSLEEAEYHEHITKLLKLYVNNEFGFDDNDGYACKVDLEEIISYVNCNTILIEKILQYTKRVKI